MHNPLLSIDISEGGDHTCFMTLSELLKPELILPKTVCISKDELISKLVERIYTTGQDIPLCQEDLLDIIYSREQIGGGTLLPSGLSVPHARLKDFEGFIIALGTPAEPLFHGGLQTHMMALMVTSQLGGPYYLPTLAALIKISKNSAYFSRLCGAKYPDDFVSMLREQDPELA